MKSILVTGSSGLIGSEVCTYFAREGYVVHGVDNNQRAVFFGPDGRHALEPAAPRARDCATSTITSWTSAIGRACSSLVRDASARRVIVHTAAQPSHDRAAAIPFDDFDTNAVGTLNLLEAARRVLPRIAVRPHDHQQGLRRRAQHDRRSSSSRRAGTTPTRLRQRHSRDVADRSVDAFAVRRVEGRGRRDGAGVRPLLRHADLLPARRLPHRARIMPASSCTGSSATS